MSTNQERLESLLRKKGIGPEGSKSLVKEELQELIPLFQDKEVSLITKATILTALLLLEPNPDEKDYILWLRQNPEKLLPEQLLGFVKETNDPFLVLIKKLISKKELTIQECLTGMKFLFDPAVPEYLKGPFLEGERLKRESFTENKTFFDFLYSKATRTEIRVPVLIDICDSYDGSSRSRNYAVFTAALLASAGYPTLVQGIDEVAPKFGHTSHQIIKEAGKNPYMSIQQAKDNLLDPLTGWAYLDQKVYFEDLYNLKKIRKEMVKRPFLATFEKLLQPVRATGGNHIATGYTHPHYREELVKQLKAQAQCAKAVVLKGVEGSTHMSLAKNTSCVVFNGKDILETAVSPSLFGIDEMEAAQDRSVTAKNSYLEGIAALQGEKNYARQNILYLAITLLSKFELVKDIPETMKVLDNCLESKKALSCWNNGNV